MSLVPLYSHCKNSWLWKKLRSSHNGLRCICLMLSKGKLRTSRSRSRLTVTTFNAWRADKMLLGGPIFLYLEWKSYSNIFFPLSLKDTWKLRNRHFLRNKIKLIWIYNNKKPSFRTFEHSSRSKIFFCVSRIIDKFRRKR